MTEKDLKNKIEDYFSTQYVEGSHFINRIKSESLEKNIETLLTRDKNSLIRIRQLEKIEKQYKDDKYKAYQDAYSEYSKIIQEEMTTEKALQVLSEMSLNDIIKKIQD